MITLCGKILDASLISVRVYGLKVEIAPLLENEKDNIVFLSIEVGSSETEETINSQSLLNRFINEKKEKQKHIKDLYIAVSDAYFKSTFMESICHSNPGLADAIDSNNKNIVSDLEQSTNKKTILSKNVIFCRCASAIISHTPFLNINMLTTVVNVEASYSDKFLTIRTSNNCEKIPVILRTSCATEPGQDWRIYGSIVKVPENFGTRKGRHGIFGTLIEQVSKTR